VWTWRRGSWRVWSSIAVGGSSLWSGAGAESETNLAVGGGMRSEASSSPRGRCVQSSRSSSQEVRWVNRVCLCEGRYDGRSRAEEPRLDSLICERRVEPVAIASR
jgi:hypothetical protein